MIPNVEGYLYLFVWIEVFCNFDLKISRLIQNIRAFLSLIRWLNLLIIVFTQYMARIFLVGPPAEWKSYILDPYQAAISLATLLIASAGYIINDYFDVKIDLINKPESVIIGRKITRRAAILTHQTLNGMGIFIGLFLGWKVLIINILAVSLLWYYASFYKKKAFIGNFLVAGLTGASLIVISVFYKQNELLINIYAIFAFSISLIREIIKDIEDMKGDEAHGCKTLPILWGVRKTKRLLYLIIVAFVCIVFLMGAYLHNPRLMMIFVFPGSLIVYLFFALVRADRKSHFADLSKLCKWIMIIGIVSMVAV